MNLSSRIRPLHLAFAGLLLGLLLGLLQPVVPSTQAASTLALVKDLMPGSTHSYAQRFIELNGTHYFLNGRYYNEYWPDSIDRVSLWKTDGTSDGTTLVKDLLPPNASYLSSGRIIGQVGGVFYISVKGVYLESALWRSDGTAEGTYQVREGLTIDERHPTAAFNNALYFSGHPVIQGSSLWRSDGTEEGTVHLPYDPQTPVATTIYDMRAVGNRLYFAAGDAGYIGSNGEDGTPYFALYVSDGTATGTTKLADFNYELQDLTALGDALYFLADGQFWRTDGSPGGTEVIAETKNGNWNIHSPQPDLINVNGILLFYRQDSQLWRSDGTAEGTYQIRGFTSNTEFAMTGPLIPVGDVVYFVGFNDGVWDDHEVWRSDGTAEGTFQLTNNGFDNAFPGEFFFYEGKMYFSMVERFIAPDKDGIRTLWETDGTVENTRRVAALDPASATETEFQRLVGGLNNELFFVGKNEATGDELWKLSGLAQATPTSTPTVTASATSTATPTESPTASPTATGTASPTATATQTSTPTSTATTTPTSTPGQTASTTSTIAPTKTATASLTATGTASPAATATSSPTATSVPNAPDLYRVYLPWLARLTDQPRVLR